MPADEAALLDVRLNENTPPGRAQRLSRSPHPYHRDRASVSQDNGSSLTQRTRPSVTQSTTVQPVDREIEPTYFDADHRKRRKGSSSTSDSGTEADDERGAAFLGLPAPPTRPRKGLKSADFSATASPLLTPSYLDEEQRNLVLKSPPKRRASLQSQGCTDEETTKIREKFARRRRAELTRRVSETLLLGAVGFIACRNDLARVLDSFAGGSLHNPVIETVPGMTHIPAALLSHAVVVLGLYILYPLRIMLKNWARSISKGRSPFYIHVPAAFEPAPLLYPILVPVFVALSLMHANAAILLPNLVLSIASIPSKIIPYSFGVPWYSSLQWLLSAIPILASRKLYQSDSQAWIQESCENSYISALDELLFLYPLHQALLPALQHLTTTSLLPAELQLLSLALIDLLLLSQSPQTMILQSLLWLGGLSVFVLCGKVLALGVALARIPSWRFRRPSGRTSEGNALVSAIDDTLSGRLSEWGLNPGGSEDSDGSDDGEIERQPEHPARKKHHQILQVDTRRTQVTVGAALAELSLKAPVLVIDDTMQAGVSAANGTLQGFQSEAQHERQRRYTVPSCMGSHPVGPPRTGLKYKRTTQTQPSKKWSLRALSKAQAIVVKWVFAIYVYAVVLAVTAFAIRSNVCRKALHGQEPVGWALGYLLGDVPPFRYLTTTWRFDHWIQLPEDMPSYALPDVYSWTLISDSLGAANIRLFICAYCLAIIGVGLAVVFRLSAIAEVDTRRKVFHGMMVAMFLPTIFVDPTFVSLAFVLILAIFLLLDLFRASQLPPLSKPLTYFLAPYVDGRDHRGPVIVSHIFLLIGCAIPLWLSLAAIRRTGDGPWKGWDVQRREVSMISGVVCVGMGDAAASLIGRRFGRRRWCWSGGKSLEGSLAFAVAVVVGLSLARLLLLIGGWDGDSRDSWAMTLGKASIAATGASLTEAVLTGGNDNVIVPIILWLLVRGLRI